MADNLKGRPARAAGVRECGAGGAGTRPGGAVPGVYYGTRPSGRLRDWLGRVYRD